MVPVHRHSLFSWAMAEGMNEFLILFAFICGHLNLCPEVRTSNSWLYGDMAIHLVKTQVAASCINRSWFVCTFNWYHSSQLFLSAQVICMGGSIAVINKDNSMCCPISTLSPLFDFLSFSINGKVPLLRVLIYRPPNLNSGFIQEISELLVVQSCLGMCVAPLILLLWILWIVPLSSP